MHDKSQIHYQAINSTERAVDISSKIGDLPPGYRLLRVDDRDGLLDGYEIALVNDLDLSLVYYNKVTLKAGRATQKAWRTPAAQHAAVIADITDKVFFDYLLQQHSIMLNDDQLTGEGSHHWQRQLSHALSRGMKVYQCKDDGQLQQIECQKELNELVDRIWSSSEKQSSTLALICKADQALD
jgi:hypothetical protein